MAELKIWFLNVGHGDAAYIELPNGARMMIDCGCGPDHWPSTLLRYFNITRQFPVSIPGVRQQYGLDNLVISHPHGDHIADIERIDEIGFYLLTGNYQGFIDRLPLDRVDHRKRGRSAAEKFVEVVKRHCGTYEQPKDRVHHARPACVVETHRFLPYSDDMDLNELSWFVSFSIGGHKVLFTGDMTAAGVRRILDSDKADAFARFVHGTTILKVPHHGRDNGCSDELFSLFGRKPKACIASDQTLNERNEGTSNIDWYHARTDPGELLVNDVPDSRRVFTTRKDKDIHLVIDDSGAVSFATNVFADLRNLLCHQ